MDYITYARNDYLQTQEVLQLIINNDAFLQNIVNIAKLCVERLNSGKKILFCGNGGSAADSQHLAAELVSRLNFDRPGLSAIALTTDTSALTAIGNDYGYEEVFARQVQAIGKDGDILFGFSTSGRSKNVIKAFESAKNANITTIGMLGIDGRNIGEISDYQVNIPSQKTPKIQEGHIATGHIICSIIEDIIFGAEYKKSK